MSREMGTAHDTEVSVLQEKIIWRKAKFEQE